MSPMLWPCARSAACAALFAGLPLALAVPAGVITLSFDGTVTSATATDGRSIGVELDLFDVIGIAFDVLYKDAGRPPAYQASFHGGNFTRVVCAGEDPVAHRAAEVALWRAINTVAQERIPSPLPSEELPRLARGFADASRALDEARDARIRSRTDATIDAVIAAKLALDAANEALAGAHSYQAHVLALLAELAGIDPADTAPATTRLPSDRPRGLP